MLFVIWMAWLISEMGPASFDDIDYRFEQRRTVEQSYREGPARAALKTLEARWRAV